MTFSSDIPPNVRANPTAPLEVEHLPSAKAGGTVTVKQFYDVMFNDDSEATETVAGWIENGQIGDEILKSNHPVSGLPLAVYLANNPKRCWNEVSALISMMPKAELERVDPKTGETALIRAAKLGNGFVLWKLAEFGANPNAVDNQNRNALMLAVGNVQHTEHIVRYLCRNGLNVNAQGRDGKTALHYAANAPAYGAARALIAAGADTTIKDEENKTPLDVAKEKWEEKETEELGHAPDTQIVTVLKTSQRDALAYIGSLFGSEFCADLLKASTVVWQAVADTMQYAFGVKMDTESSRFLAEENKIEGQDPAQAPAAPSYDELEKQNEPINEVVAAPVVAEPAIVRPAVDEPVVIAQEPQLAWDDPARFEFVTAEPAADVHVANEAPREHVAENTPSEDVPMNPQTLRQLIDSER